jgi:hypothetical protein
MATTYPAFTVAFAPGVDPSAIPTAPDWVDITSLVTAEWSVKWGRWGDDYAPTGAGTASLTIANDLGTFDPDNSSGAYYGDLVAGTWFRIKGGTTTADKDVFYGHVSDDGFQLEASQFPGGVDVRVDLVDDLEQLANTDLPGSVWQIEATTDTPAAWYGMDESSGTSAFDLSGNGNTGTYEGGATFNSRATIIEGDTGAAIEWAPDQRVVIPQVVTDFGFTVEAWVDTADTWVNNGTIYHQAVLADPAAGSAHSYAFLGFTAVANEAVPRITILINGVADAEGYYRDGSALTPGVHHIVGVFPAAGSAMPGGLKLYVDGVEVTTGGYAVGTPLPAFPTGMQNVAIGNNAGDQSLAGGGGDFQGTLDDVVIYDSELSAVRIAAHYTAGSAPWGSELSGARATHLADAVAYDATNRDFDTGSSTLQPADLNGGDAASAFVASPRPRVGSSTSTTATAACSGSWAARPAGRQLPA